MASTILEQILENVAGGTRLPLGIAPTATPSTLPKDIRATRESIMEAVEVQLGRLLNKVTRLVEAQSPELDSSTRVTIERSFRDLVREQIVGSPTEQLAPSSHGTSAPSAENSAAERIREIVRSVKHLPELLDDTTPPEGDRETLELLRNLAHEIVEYDNGESRPNDGGKMILDGGDGFRT